MKYKVLIVCGCKTPLNNVYRIQQSELIKLFSQYTLDPYNPKNTLIIKDKELDFLTINISDDADFIIKGRHIESIHKGHKGHINLKEYFDFIVYEHCPFSIIPEEHKIYSDMLKVNGIVIFYAKVDFDKVIDSFYNGKEIENYMFTYNTNTIYNNSLYYRKISGISFQKL